jgi:hypothetical protein
MFYVLHATLKNDVSLTKKIFGGLKTRHMREAGGWADNFQKIETDTF